MSGHKNGRQCCGTERDTRGHNGQDPVGLDDEEACLQDQQGSRASRKLHQSLTTELVAAGASIACAARQRKAMHSCARLLPISPPTNRPPTSKPPTGAVQGHFGTSGFTLRRLARLLLGSAQLPALQIVAAPRIHPSHFMNSALISHRRHRQSRLLVHFLQACTMPAI